MMPYKRGDIIELPQIIVAMVTSNLSHSGHPSRIFISLTAAAKRQTGLISDSVVVTDNLVTDNLVTVAEMEISHALGAWRNMAAVDDALRHTFGLR